jgi:dTDP-glucose 4,6-dehydratase
MGNLLVTGGAGFIGSNFVLRHKELHPDDTIVVLDALREGSDKCLLDPIIGRIRFVEGDITNIELVSKLILGHEISTIVNFAAETHVDRSITNAAPFIHSNILGVQSLIEVCRHAPNVRLLHISTDEVYGDVSDDDPGKIVGSALYPSSPYAATKAAAEMLLLAAMRTYKIHCCITRCTNNYGPHQASEKFVPTVIRSALAGKPIPIYGQGKNKRDWLYVTDHCDALELILQTDWAFWDSEVPGVDPSQPKGSGHLFNVSANDEHANIDVAKMILKILDKPESLLNFVADRPGHDWRYAVDSRPIRKLGWQPKVNFEEGLRKTVEWYAKCKC